MQITSSWIQLIGWSSWHLVVIRCLGWRILLKKLWVFNLYCLQVFVADMTDQILKILLCILLSDDWLHVWIKYINFILYFCELISQLLNLLSQMILIVYRCPFKLRQHLFYIFSIYLDEYILLKGTCFKIIRFHLHISILAWVRSRIFPVLV